MPVYREVGDAIEGELVVCEYDLPKRLKPRPLTGKGEHAQWRVKLRGAFCVVDKKVRWIK